MKRVVTRIAFVIIAAIGLLFPIRTLNARTISGDITGTVNVKRSRNSSDAVVYIERIPGKTFAPPAKHPTMDQKRMVFIPHVLPILAGTTVDFLNSDPVKHNIFTPSPAGDKFNLGTWPAGIVKTFTFRKPGVVTLLCNVHPEMSAYIVVTETPYYAVTNANGGFTIRGVPPGSYTISAWHERSKKAVTQNVTVPASGSVTANFEL
jgi:plastocyanin